MFSNFNNTQNNNNQPSFKEKVKSWWLTVPLYVRFIMITTTVFYLLSWFLKDFMTALTNIPAYVIYNIQLWRLFTSTFVTLSIFNILFGFLAWIPDAMRLEYTSGTIKYMFTFMINSISIQILYVGLAFALSIISKQIILMSSSGLWPVIMSEITILCLTNPENQLKMMFLPWLISAKFYPWLIFAFFSILNMKLQFDIVAGIIYGYSFHYFLKSKIQLSDEFVLKAENNTLINKLTKLNSFVSASKAASINDNINYSSQSTNPTRGENSNSRNVNENSFNQIPISKPVAPTSTPFQGAGRVLGSTGYHKDLTDPKNTGNENDKNFNNLIGNNVQNLDEEFDNPYKNIKFEDQKTTENVHSKLIDSRRKEDINDKYDKFQDRI